MLGADTTRVRQLVDLEANEQLPSRVSLSDDEAFSDQERFEIVGDLGGGAYGTVYKARDKSKQGQVVALKKMYITEDPEIGIPPFVMREVANLKRLSEPPDGREPYIVRLLDVLSSEGRFENELIFYMVFEYMEQDLDHFIKQCPVPGLEEGVVKDFLGQILQGVDWMHVNNIVHRDLKPQNILVSRNGKKIKIADFGLSRLIGSNVVLSTQVVTQWYRAPEVLLHSSYNNPVDIWSVGCIFAEMISGRPLFASTHPGEKSQLDKIFSVIGTPPKESWPSQSAVTFNQFVSHKPILWPRIFAKHSKETHDLLSIMLKFDGSERITAERALKHSYFSDSQTVGVGSSSHDNRDGYHRLSPASSSSSGSASPTSSSSILDLSISTDSGIQES